MKQEEFNLMNDIFNDVIKKSDLLETTDQIDGESVLFRVFNKIDGQIPVNILPSILIYNIFLMEENYIGAKNMKEHILKNLSL